MNLSDVIEQFLLELLEEENDIILKRNELALRFRCAPSQINYVIDTRFTGQRGYIVESRRGGGGFIRIQRLDINENNNYIMHVVNSVGDSVSFDTISAILQNMLGAGVLNEKENRLLLTALSDRAIPLNQPALDAHRAKLFKNMLISLI